MMSSAPLCQRRKRAINLTKHCALCRVKPKFDVAWRASSSQICPSWARLLANKWHCKRVEANGENSPFLPLVSFSSLILLGDHVFTIHMIERALQQNGDRLRKLSQVYRMADQSRVPACGTPDSLRQSQAVSSSPQWSRGRLTTESRLN